MIDAKRFATVYNAFWRDSTPTCDLFVRRINMDGYERWAAPLDLPRGRVREALAAESAFEEFAALLQGKVEEGGERGEHGTAGRNAAWLRAAERLRPYQARGLDVDTPMSKLEEWYVGELARRLIEYFSFEQGVFEMRPKFPGCGFIDVSEGDVVVRDILYEVKAVDRMFRSVDIRQLLSYAALNFEANVYNLKSIGVVNPRRGIAMTVRLDDVCQSVSGRSVEELLSYLIDNVSSGEMSR